MKRLLASLFALIVGVTAVAADAVVSLRFSGTDVGFALPAGWKPYIMSRRHAPAAISIVADAGTNVLHIDAKHAAGAIGHELDLPASIRLSWRWKIDHSVAAADFMHKRGDDFAARLYVFFDLPASALTFGQRFKLRLARAVLGYNPPRAALCYVWDNKHRVGTIATSAFYSGVHMIVLQSGDNHAGTWQIQQRDLASDFRAAFHRPAPRITGVALAADTDNTGSHANAWFGDLTFTPAGSASQDAKDPP